MWTSKYPPPASSQREVGVWGSSSLVVPEPSGRQFASRLRSFSIARALVFTVAAGVVAFALTKNAGGFRFGYSMKVTVTILMVAYGSALLQWIASRRRLHMYTVALCLIVVDQALFGGIAFVTGGVTSGATSLFGVACLVGGLLLGVPGSVAAALAGGVFFSLIVLTTQGKNGLRPPDQPADLYLLSEGQAAYYYVFNILMLLLVGLLASYLAERLQRAGGELKDAKRRVDHAERLASLGRLAAGLAHEIRNPLGAISGSVQMLRSGARDKDDQALCDIVLRESGRLNELVSDMMDLSRPRELARSATDLGQIVSDVVELARKSGRGAYDVELVRQGPERAIVDADSGQIRQLVWNLVRNALQATGAGGQVRVRLEKATHVTLTVEDNGIGIEKEAMDRLFDVFYTTRSKGTGLGLAVVKKIADDHEFDITVTSDQGKGASFCVDFGPPKGT